MTEHSAYPIPNIHIGRVYDRRDPECDVHYETFGRLAEFFGRNTPMHRHYSFFQVHVLTRGSINLNLDGALYRGTAPLLILTPPTLPHGFYTEEDTDGHVLTIRQEVVRQWYHNMPGQWAESLLRDPVFLEIDTRLPPFSRDFTGLVTILSLLQTACEEDARGRQRLLLVLGEAAFIHMARLISTYQPVPTQRNEHSESLRIFLNFCDLVETHFRDHLTLRQYAEKLAVTEARLNDICRRTAYLASKEIVHERLLQEARRLLRFTTVPVSEIGYLLGFSDPAYFSRFFTKRTGIPPSQYRISI